MKRLVDVVSRDVEIRIRVHRQHTRVTTKVTMSDARTILARLRSRRTKLPKLPSQASLKKSRTFRAARSLSDPLASAECALRLDGAASKKLAGAAIPCRASL